MKSAVIAMASIAGTLGVVAAIGFAQPDRLEPPAGPVEDTQPSLASISQQVATLGTGPGPASTHFAADRGEDGAGNFVTVATGSGVLDRLIVNKRTEPIGGWVELRIDGEFAGLFRAGYGPSTSAAGVQSQYDLNLRYEQSVAIDAAALGYLLLYTPD